MNGRTVVTIRMDGFQRDIELPEALPLRTLCVQRLELLAIPHDGRDRAGRGQHADAERQRIAERLRYL